MVQPKCQDSDLSKSHFVMKSATEFYKYGTGFSFSLHFFNWQLNNINMSISGLQTGASERTLFLGPRVPNNVKLLPKLLPSVNKTAFKSLIKLAVTDLEGKNVTAEMYQAVKSSCDDDTNVDVVYSALYMLLKSALRIPEISLKQELFKDDLRELKIPEEYIGDFVDVVYGPRRPFIDMNSINSSPHLPRLENLRWRVDVAISTSALNRVLEPSVLMEMTTSDGKKETFEVQPTQFHQLRFAVAMLLKEVEDLEKKNVIKMQT